MGCTQTHSKHRANCEQNCRLLPMEVEYLQMMYRDLAVRSKTEKLTRENFDIFFHLSGLWGKEMFERFNNKSTEATISESDFIRSIGLMVKGTFAEKCDFLFRIYDINETGGISYNQFLKMLYSYPKQELKEMLTDKKFLQSFDPYQLMFFFDPARGLQDKNIQVDVQDEDSNTKKLHRIETECIVQSAEYIEIEGKLKEEIERRKNDKEGRKAGLKTLKASSPIRKSRRNRSDNISRVVSATEQFTYKLSNVKLTNNITSLVKRYATYIFKLLKLDKSRHEISPEQFKALVEKQQKIFNVYLEGFHTYIWWVDVEQGLPVAQHQKMTPWIEDECLEVQHPHNNYDQRIEECRYLRFIRTTIFVSKKKGRKCVQIRNMEGLYVQEVINVSKLKHPPGSRKEITDVERLAQDLTEEDFAFGILFKHRDGIYPEKQYFFRDRKTQKEWMRYLFEFRENSVYNEYQILEKIGEGSYASVYRGIPIQSELKASPANSTDGDPQKSNDVQPQKDRIAGEGTAKPNGGVSAPRNQKVSKEVAIKVIEKFKLSQSENQVIQFECGILKLCHHPNIVHYEKQYNTKTRIYIITEYLGEGDLFDYAKRNGFLEEYEAATVMKQLFEVVRYLNHDLGLIHRDLKPENVLITTKPQQGAHSNPVEGKNTAICRIKLIDFGFAVYKKNLETMSEKQKFAGSPGYIAPEIFKREDYDEGIDMFSLGIIMYFILCGKLPFQSPILEDIAEQTVECNVCLNNVHWTNISEEAKDLLLSILTLREERITVKQALDHPWLQDIDTLKVHIGKNKKNRYVG